MARLRKAHFWAAGLLLVASLVSACGTATPSPEPSGCNGVSADICGLAQPSLAGTDCASVGSEWAQAVDVGIRAVLDGPANVDGKQRSARIGDVMVLAFVNATGHLEALGALRACSAEAFLKAAEPEFSDELRTRVGAALYDGEPSVGYDEFLAEVRNVVGVLDEQ